MAKITINPLQFIATPDGWIDWTKWPEPEILCAELRSAGWRAVQVGPPVGMSLENYREMLKKFDLEISPGYMSGPLHDPAQRKQTVSRFREAAAEHAQLGLTEIFVACAMDRTAARIQRPGAGVDSDESRLDEIAETLNEVGRATLEEGVMSCVHPHTGTWLETEAEAEYVLSKVDSEILALGPDTGHMVFSGTDPVKFLSRHSSRVRGIHIKDVRVDVLTKARAENASYQETVLAGLWAEPGSGDVPLDRCLDTLAPSFDGWCVIEVDRHTSTLTPLESVEACAQWAHEHGGIYSD